jgi:hypothetical protein
MPGHVSRKAGDTSRKVKRQSAANVCKGYTKHLGFLLDISTIYARREEG